MLIVAGIVTLVFKRLKQPLVLGYVVAGFLVSPHMPYTASVVDLENIQLWADIGVMFLLFSLGLDFSFKKILKMGASPIISACSIIFCMSMLGVIVGHLFQLRELAELVVEFFRELVGQRGVDLGGLVDHGFYADGLDVGLDGGAAEGIDAAAARQGQDGQQDGQDACSAFHWMPSSLILRYSVRSEMPSSSAAGLRRPPCRSRALRISSALTSWMDTGACPA